MYLRNELLRSSLIDSGKISLMAFTKDVDILGMGRMRKETQIKNILKRKAALTDNAVNIFWDGFFSGGLLLFCRIGFNGGSAFAVSEKEINAIMVTLLSTAADTISWMVVNWRHGKQSFLGFLGTIACSILQRLYQTQHDKMVTGYILTNSLFIFIRDILKKFI